MRSLHLFLIALFASSSIFAWPPLERVLILTGGGLNTALFLGIIDGYKERNGVYPNLIIATCGASAAAALYHFEGDKRRRLSLVKSKPYYEEMRRLTIIKANATGTSLLGSIGNLAARGASEKPYLPILSVFEKADRLAEVPQNLASTLVRGHFLANDRRILLAGARMLYGPEEVGTSPDKKLFEEAYYTDVQTARHLKGALSIVPEQFPKSSVAKETRVYTDFSLAQAVRIAVSDLSYMEPVKCEQGSFCGSFINLYPIELGLKLGVQIEMNLSGEFSDPEKLVTLSTAGYEAETRRQNLIRTAQDHRDRVRLIDIVDQRDVEKYSFNPKVTQDLPWTQWVHFGLPDTHEKYVEAVDEMYRWGYEKALSEP